MDTSSPLSSYDSRQRIQFLWEYLQRDIVELEAETDQPPDQTWYDFIHGDVQTGGQFFKDFVELFYITRLDVNKKNDQDITRLVAQINNWKDGVKTENMMVEDRKSPARLNRRMNLVQQGIVLFREYEKALKDGGYIQVVSQTSSMK
jgi:hypothetical protein